MARTNKTKNKFSSIANNAPRNLPFRETLPIDQRVEYDKLTPEQQVSYEKFCNDHPSSHNVSDYLEYRNVSKKDNVEIITKDKNNNKIVSSVESEEKEAIINPIASVQSLINNDLAIEEEAGKNISVYLSAEALSVIKDYMKKHKIKNRSKLIETLVLNILKEK